MAISLNSSVSRWRDRFLYILTGLAIFSPIIIGAPKPFVEMLSSLLGVKLSDYPNERQLVLFIIFLLGIISIQLVLEKSLLIKGRLLRVVDDADVDCALAKLCSTLKDVKPNYLGKAIILEKAELLLKHVKKVADKNFDADEFYEGILLTAYKNASSNILAASAPGYFDNWDKQLGKHIKEVNEEAIKRRVKVTRIFVFKNKTDVSPQYKNELKAQGRLGVDVRLYFEDESDNKISKFPTGMSQDYKDFAVIDNGYAVAITQRDRSKLVAHWYLGDPKAPPNDEFAKYGQEMLNLSYTLDKCS